MLISKKNMKSTLAAGVMLTALVLNWRREAEFFIIAPTVEVANNSFKPAKAMIRADEELSALFQVQDHTRTITHRTTGATLKILAAESDTVAGIKGTGVLIEEVWLFGKRSKAADMFTEAKGGLASRPEGFVIYLSTMSDEAPAGVFENFYVTNPNIGASVSEAYLMGEFETAKADGEIALRRFMAKHLNVQIALSLTADYWPGAEFWEKGGNRPEIDLDWMLEHCEVIDIGVDGGGLDDLLGISAVGRLKDNPRIWAAWFHAWAHPSVLERRKEIAPALLDFAKHGDLTIVNRIGDDSDEVAGLVARVYQSGLLDKCGLDPHGVGAILDAMLEYGVPEEAVVGVSQGWKLGAAIKTAERKLAEGCFIHNGSAMMNWVVGNARVEPRANGILITKQASGSAKIDPLMAMFDAVSLLSLNPTAKGASVYETRGIRML